MGNKEKYLKNAIKLYAFLFVVWGFYRLLFQLPDTIEEIIIKPLIWLIPVFALLKKEKLGITSLGFTTNNLFKSVYLALALGAIFAMEAMGVNFLKYSKFLFNANLGENIFLIALGLSMITAIVEEITFRGYLFNRVWAGIENEWIANIIVGIGWAMIHMPIAIFDWKLDLISLLIYFGLTFAFAVGASFVFAKTRNIIAPILLHILWQWPIILFR